MQLLSWSASTAWATHYHYDPIAFTGTLLPSPVIACGLRFHLLLPQTSQSSHRSVQPVCACLALHHAKGIITCSKSHQTMLGPWHFILSSLQSQTPHLGKAVKCEIGITDLQIPWDSEILALQAQGVASIETKKDKGTINYSTSHEIKKYQKQCMMYESMIDSPWISRQEYRWSWAQETFFNVSQKRHKQANLQWSSNALQTSPSAEHSWCTCA